MRKVKSLVPSHITSRWLSWAPVCLSAFSVLLVHKMCSLLLETSHVAPPLCSSVSDYLGVVCVALMGPLVWVNFLGPLILVPYWWRETQRNVGLRFPSPESWGLPRTQLALSAEDQRTQNPSGEIAAVSGINERTDKEKEEAGRKPMRAKEKVEVVLSTSLPLFKVFSGDQVLLFQRKGQLCECLQRQVCWAKLGTEIRNTSIC